MRSLPAPPKHIVVSEAEGGRVIGNAGTGDQIGLVEQIVERIELAGQRIVQGLEEVDELGVDEAAGSGDHIDDVGGAVGREHVDAADRARRRRRAVIGEIAGGRGELENEALERSARIVLDLKRVCVVGENGPAGSKDILKPGIERRAGDQRAVDEGDICHRRDSRLTQRHSSTERACVAAPEGGVWREARAAASTNRARPLVDARQGRARRFSSASLFGELNAQRPPP